jgi:hypothetical protein
MLRQKYQIKGPDVSKLKAYTKVCIGCGKQETAYVHPAFPLPNTTRNRTVPHSRLRCLFGVHDFVPEHNLEPASR